MPRLGFADPSVQGNGHDARRGTDRYLRIDPVHPESPDLDRLLRLGRRSAAHADGGRNAVRHYARASQANLRKLTRRPKYTSMAGAGDGPGAGLDFRTLALLGGEPGGGPGGRASDGHRPAAGESGHRCPVAGPAGPVSHRRGAGAAMAGWRSGPTRRRPSPQPPIWPRRKFIFTG